MDKRPPLFSTKPEALAELKSGRESTAAWRQKGGRDRNKIIVARLEGTKVATEVKAENYYSAQ